MFENDCFVSQDNHLHLIGYYDGVLQQQQQQQRPLASYIRYTTTFLQVSHPRY